MKKNVTMASIASRLNISVSEVSRVFTPDYPMNPEKRALILKTAREMGYVRNEAASRLSMKPIRIGIVYTNLHPEFDGEMLRGFRQAENLYLSYKLLCDYAEFKYSCPDENSETMNEIISGLIASGCDGIILAVFFEGIEEIIARYSQKINIALVNYDLPDEHLLLASLNNPPAVAAMAAQLLSMAAPGAKTLVVAGNENKWDHINIVENFGQYAASYGLDIVRVCHAVSEAETIANLEKSFADFPYISAIYVTSAVSIPICEYIERERLVGKVAVVASDVFSRLNRYILNQTVMATIYQNPTLQAFSALEGMFKYIANHIKPERRIVMRPEIVMRCNLGLYTENTSEK